MEGSINRLCINISLCRKKFKGNHFSGIDYLNLRLSKRSMSFAVYPLAMLANDLEGVFSIFTSTILENLYTSVIE